MNTPPSPASVILLNYNTRALLVETLERISSPLLRAGWEIIVVDNGSSDGSVQEVAARFGDVHLIASTTNVGYAAGNNLGLREAQHDTFLLLNTDVIVTPEQLRALVQYLQGEPGVGAVSPGLRTVDGAAQAFAYGGDPSPAYLFRRSVRRVLRLGPLHDWDVKSPSDADWVSGACLAVRKAVYDQIGGLDERFFLYFEDVDWCARIRKAGWRVVYNPTIQVTHLGGQSQPRRAVANDFYSASMRTYYRIHYPHWPGWLLDAAVKIYYAR